MIVYSKNHLNMNILHQQDLFQFCHNFVHILAIQHNNKSWSRLLKRILFNLRYLPCLNGVTDVGRIKADPE